MTTILAAPPTAAPPVPCLVTTRRGRVCGEVADGIHAFKGIPYAAPPFGHRRLLPPQPPAPWPGTRGALAWGREVPQLRPDAALQRLVPDPAVGGEDCLNLNVWTPALAPAALPVMVWIHGGMFEAGTGASYDGSRFARDGVVCVTINWRVGAEGFLYLGDGIANLGLLDQIAALEWVRDEIAAFGGDPHDVTVFGESAGAMSIGVLLAMPRAEGLFRRAILQSGGAHPVMSAPTALRSAQALADRLGIRPARAAFAAVPIDRFLAAQAELKGELLAHPDPARWGAEVVASMLPWHPVVDGDAIPAPPIERIEAGAGARVDVLVGTNVDEWRLFLVWGGALERITEAILTGPAAEHGQLTLEAFGLPASALAAYRAAYPGATPGDLLAAVQTDWYTRVPALRLAEAHALGGAAGTWMYELAWRSPAFGGALGACHALDIPFVFDTLDQGEEQMVGPLLGPSPPQELADAMHGAWTRFATTGDPGWPRYDHVRRATMRFDTTSRVVRDPRRMERELWGVL